MSSLARSKTLAVCAVGGSIATLGYMWIAGAQTKAEEGPASMYKRPEEGKGVMLGGGGGGGTDSRLSSREVRATVQGERKP